MTKRFWNEVAMAMFMAMLFGTLFYCIWGQIMIKCHICEKEFATIKDLMKHPYHAYDRNDKVTKEGMSKIKDALSRIKTKKRR